MTPSGAGAPHEVSHEASREALPARDLVAGRQAAARARAAPPRRPQGALFAHAAERQQRAPRERPKRESAGGVPPSGGSTRSIVTKASGADLLDEGTDRAEAAAADQQDRDLDGALKAVAVDAGHAVVVLAEPRGRHRLRDRG